MTAATIRKNKKAFAHWANQTPFSGGDVSGWVARGVKVVTGSTPWGPSDRVMACFVKMQPPASWEPQGAANRLYSAVQRTQAVRAAIKLADEQFEARKAAFLDSLDRPGRELLESFAGAPVAAIEGREVNTAPLESIKTSVVVTASLL